MSSLFVKFEELAENDRFYFDVEGETVSFHKRKGTAFGRSKRDPIDFNALSKFGDGWQFDATDLVLKV